MIKHMMMLAGLLLSMKTFASTCYMTLMKDNCWTNYDVTVTVTDASSNKLLTTINAPTANSWGRQKFDCQPGESLAFSAVFSPVFWQKDEGKHYVGSRTMRLPETMKEGHTAWTFSVCYSAAFSEVPLPPEAKGNCVCDPSGIPPVTVDK
jgi:hypothetical protein